jgi:hypothetical protein
MGLKYREPNLYWLYAQCQEAHGMPEEAAETFKTARDLATQLGLPEPGVETSPVQAQPVVILPSVMATEVQPGELARARFQLINPSTSEQDGILFITGGQLACRAELPVIHIEPAAQRPATPFEVPLVLSPQSTTDIFFETEHPADLAGSPVALYWSTGGRTASWMCSTVTGGTPRREIVHSSYIADNPFYSSAFYHELYLRDNPGRPRNLRMTASQPCRIELLDLSTGLFLAADANGDGDFRDAGDVIWQDADRDLFPDVSGAEVQMVELRVYPLDTVLPETLTVTLSRKDGAGDWQDEALTVLKMSR